MKNSKLKYRIYAIYQFFTFIGMMLIVFSLFSFILSSANKNIYPKDWVEVLKQISTFQNAEAVGIFGSFLFYLGIAFLLLTYPMGWLILLIKDRNMFDRMFLMFVLVPVISNLLGLAAQIALGSSKFTEERISKAEIDFHKTQIMKSFKKNKKEIKDETIEMGLTKKHLLPTKKKTKKK